METNLLSLCFVRMGNLSGYICGDKYVMYKEKTSKRNNAKIRLCVMKTVGLNILLLLLD